MSTKLRSRGDISLEIPCFVQTTPFQRVIVVQGDIFVPLSDHAIFGSRPSPKTDPLRKVQAQRKFAQGAYIPPQTNNNTIERRGEGHDKPAPPPAILQSMSAGELLDKISFYNIHSHDREMQPVVRLERLPRIQPDRPRIRRKSSFVTDTSTNTFAASIPSLFHVVRRTRAKNRVLRKSVAIKKAAKIEEKKRVSRVVRPRRDTRKRQIDACCKEDTDSEDNTPLQFLARSKKLLKTAPAPARVSPVTRRRPKNPAPVQAEPKASTSTDYEGFYSADNIERWINAAAETTQFKVPLPPRDTRRTKSTPSKVKLYKKDEPASRRSRGLKWMGGQPRKGAKPLHNLSNSTVIIEDVVPWPPSRSHVSNAQPVSVQPAHGDDARSVASDVSGSCASVRAPSSCPSERYVTVQDVVRADVTDRPLRCLQCSYCSRVGKLETLSRVMQATTSVRGADVYEFDAERDGDDSHPREFRSRRRSDGHDSNATDSEYVYLDILPSPSTHVIQIKQTHVPNQKKPMLQARLMPKTAAAPLNEYNLVEHEGLFEQLIETLDSRFRKRINDPKPSEVRDVSGPVNARANEANSKADAGPSVSNGLDNEMETSKRNVRTRTSVVAKRGRGAGAKGKPGRPAIATRRQSKAGPSKPGPAAPATPPAGAGADAALPVPSASATLSVPRIEKKSVAVVRDAPVYYPTEAEFNDPVAYFEKIMPTASKFGLCKVVAPEAFKPKCTVNDKIRFNVANQYIARLYTRWGPACKEMCAIKAHLASQSVPFTRAPILDSLEVDLPKLYRTVQRLGGLKTVIEKKLWGRVAEQMRFAKRPKIVKKLDDIYVRYLLPYDTLSSQEREDIRTEVYKSWHEKNRKIMQRMENPLHRQKQLLGESPSSTSDTEDESNIACALTEAEDCIVAGPRMTLANFTKVAEAVKNQYFPETEEPSPREVEEEYWRIVLLAAEHICVNTASIDTGEEGYGFPKSKQDAYGRHPWNPKMISENPGNVLAMLGPVLGVTVPTLHLGMIFSTSCWHRDPHGLPWMEYMHSGPAKIWYGIPDDQSAAFRSAVEHLCPTSCQNKSIWLPSDITMIPPHFLLSNNVSLTRVEQKPGEYIIVFPKAYSSSISTGYTQSESVYFATNSWLKSVDHVFHELRDSCEPTMFSLEQLLISVAGDPRAPPSLLQLVHTTLATVVDDELQHRRELSRLGLVTTAASRPARNKPAGAWNDECEVCRATLYLSKVIGLIDKKASVCLKHALRLLTSTKTKRDVTGLSLVVFFTQEQLGEVMSKLQSGICPQ